MSQKLILQAIKGEAFRSPVWMMRQAGRHLPEYRKLKEKYSFLELCKTPMAAAEASLQPLNRYDMDGLHRILCPQILRLEILILYVSRRLDCQAHCLEWIVKQ